MGRDALQVVRCTGDPLSMTWHTPVAQSSASVVVATGIFDLLHIGHVSFLEFARSVGDRLLVGVEDDARTRHRKGPSRPVVPAADRAAVLAALRAVDGVFVVHGSVARWDPQAYAELMKPLQPASLAFTEGDHAEPGKREAARMLGAHVAVAPLVPDRSTTALLAVR